MERYSWNILGMVEVRWTGAGKTETDEQMGMVQWGREERKGWLSWSAKTPFLE